MRVGIFTDTYTPDINGVVTSVRALEKQLRKMGHEVYIVCPHKGHKSEIEGNVYKVPGMELKHLYGYVLSVPYDKEIKEAIEKLNLDIIHVQQEFSVSIFGRIIAHNLDIPIVYTYHTMYEDYTNYVNLLNIDVIDQVAKKIVERGTRLMCSSAQYIIAPSYKTKEKLRQYRVKRPIEIVPTGIEIEKFNTDNLNNTKLDFIRAKYGLSENDFIFLYVGRIAEEKSIDVVIDGFNKLNADNAKLLIVGGGPSLKGFINQNKDNDKIIFTDKIKADDIPYYYAVSDVFASASVTETQGLTYIEAMASGLPLLASKHELAVTDIVEDEVNGYKFEDADDLAKIMKNIMQDPIKLQQMSNNAKERANKYSVEAFGANIERIYKMAIEDFKGCFEISSIKSSDDCMKLKLINKKENIECKLVVSLDDYIFYDLKKDGLLDFTLYEVLKEKEKVINAYRGCIKKLKVKDRTRKEMYDYLINLKDPIDIKHINEIIERLESKGYINDVAYTIDAITSLDNLLLSKKRIISKLQEKGIPRELTLEYLNVDDDKHEFEKAFKKGTKYQKNMRNKSLKQKKNDIRNKLLRDGFSLSIANEVLDNLNFEDDILQEVVNLKKAVEKAYNSYSKKYEGKELKNRIIRNCMNKGYMYDDIVEAINSMEEE